MRNIFKTSLAAIFVMATCMLAFTSCSDDDDDNGGAPSGNGSAMVTEAKVLLDYISHKEDNYGEEVMFKYKYDEQLRPYFCTELDDYDDIFYIDYKAGKIDFWDEYEGLSISFNSKGYITKISGSWNYKDDEEDYSSKGSLTYALNYDASGQLVTVDMSENGTEVEGGYIDNYKTITKGTFTWKDGNLMKYESTTTYSGDYNGTDKGVLSFTYGNQTNKYRQQPGFMCDDDMGFTGAGLLGVGSKMLPETITVYDSYEEDGYEHESEYGYTGTFTLNDDGTIKEEKWVDSETGRTDCQYVFHYIPVSAASSAKANVAPAPLTRSSARSKIERIRKALGVGLFMPHRKSNR